MPIIAYAPFGPVFSGENCLQEAREYEIAEALSGYAPHFYEKHRDTIKARIEEQNASLRDRWNVQIPAEISSAKASLQNLGQRIETARTRRPLAL